MFDATMATSSAENQFENHQKNAVPEIATYINYPTDFHIFDSKWLPSFPTKFVTVGATSKSAPRGFMQISELNGDQLDVIKIIEKKCAFRCATFGAIVRNASTLSLGTFFGSLQIFDMERFDFPFYDVQAHDGILNCLDGMGDGNRSEIVTGGKDGRVKVWDPRQGDAVVCISAVQKEDGGNGYRDCWSVSFADGCQHLDRTVIAGYENGDIKVIDLRILKERSSHNVRSGVCKLDCNGKYAKTTQLVAGTTDGSVHLFDLDKNELNGKRDQIAKSTAIWSVNYLPQQDNIFASVGDSVEIWRHRERSESLSDEQYRIESLTKMPLSSAGVNCFDWNPDFNGLAVCGSFDQQIRILITSGL